MLEKPKALENIELLEDRVPIKLSEYQLTMLAGKISQKLEDWSTACQPHARETQKIRKYIYTSQKGEHTEGDNYTLPAIYKLNEAIKAHIKENVYPTNAAVFDAKGDDEDSQKTANLHKWDIVKDLEKIDFKNMKANAFLKNLLESGEMIALVGLCTKTTKRKVEVEVPETVMGLMGEELETTVIKLGLEDIETYEGIEVYPIKSEDFFFDTTKADRFDSSVCGKITKKWLSYDEIVNNKAYELLKKDKYGKETKEYLEKSIKDQEPDEEMMSQDDTLRGVSRELFAGDQAEIIDFWGDIVVDKKELKNYLITLAGNRVIRCEPNPIYNNGFIYYARDTHPEYKRGISPLRVALKSADISSNITNEILMAFPYIANPVTYSPKGAIINKKKRPPPGGTIEYDTDLNKTPPVPIIVKDVLNGFQLIEFFDIQTQAAVGMSQAMLGAETEEKKTATEIKAIQIGGSIRISDMIDGIKQGFNIPLIRKLADLKANFEEGDVSLGAPQEDGSVKQETITDGVRKGKYHYTYIDSKGTMERQAQFRDVLKFLQIIMKINPNIVNLKEMLKTGLMETGYQDVERFLNKDKLEEAIRLTLEKLGIETNPEYIEKAKEKLIEHLPEITKRIIEDESRTEEPVPNQRMGAMPSSSQTGSVSFGGEDQP